MPVSPEDRKAAEIDAALKADRARKDAAEAEEQERKKVEERKDAENGETLNKILSCLDALNSRMDSYDKARKNGAEAAAMDAAKKDGEKMEEEGDPRPLKADSRHDSDSRPRTISDSERDELAEIQSYADSVCSAWGSAVDKPMMNELPDEYRQRTARKHQQHSAAWKECNLRELSGVALKNATDQIFKDSFAMAGSNEPWVGGALRETRRTDPETGHRIKEFYGEPRAWMEQFMMPRQRARFDMDAIKRSMRGDR